MTACLRSMLKKVIQIPRNEYLSIIVPKYEGVLRCYSQKPYTNRSTVTDPETGVQKKKKTTIIPKITLLDGNNVTVTTLDEAQKISKRRDLKLVKLVDIDTKTQRTVYKLMTGAEYHQEDLKQREQKKTQKQNAFIKGEKVLMLNASIGPHDLEVDCKKITKWIEKMYEVRVIINGDKEKSVRNFVLAFILVC